MPSPTELVSTIGSWASFMVPSLLHAVIAFLVRKFQGLFTAGQTTLTLVSVNIHGIPSVFKGTISVKEEMQ